MKHDYKPDCMCYRCKGIRNSPAFKAKPAPKKRTPRKPKTASREEQNARYLDCGPPNWDDR